VPDPLDEARRGWAALDSRPPSPTGIADFFKPRAPRRLHRPEDPMSRLDRPIPEAARDFLAGRRLDEVECIVPDIAGVARGKAMPAWKFDKQTSFYLPTSIFLQTITGDWADSPGARTSTRNRT
jgi:hypothetical protein